MTKRYLPLLFGFVAATLLHADGPGDNRPEKVRAVPPPGITIAETDRAELQDGVEVLGKDIERLRQDLKEKPALLELLPDVQIFHNAVRYALTYDEFYGKNEVAIARKLLASGYGTRQAVARGQGTVDDGDRPGRARLSLEDRRFGAALWPGRAAVVSGRTVPTSIASTSGATAAARS